MGKRFFISAAAVLCLIVVIIFWFSHRLDNVMGEGIAWEERKVVWEDFQVAPVIDGDFDANITSKIIYPERFRSKENIVQAFMYPDFSFRTEEADESEQLLIHEQYHFNITAYHARLLRKVLVEKGASLSKRNILYHYNRINNKMNKMQEEYDIYSEHNLTTEEQRYWELKVDDLLRETAYYENPDLEYYYNFRKPKTRFYRKVTTTVRQKILTSYPALANDTLKGVTYEVIENKNQTIVKHRINGQLVAGGDFEAAIAVIDYSPKKNTVHFLDKDSLPLASKNYTKLVIETPDEYTMISTYFDKNNQPTHGSNPENPQPNVYKKEWKFTKDLKKANVTFYDVNDKPTFLDNHIYSYQRFFDPEGRSIGIEQYDASGVLKMDKNLAAIYEYSYDNHNNISRVRILDDKREFAKHKNGYNLFLEFDERGNISKKHSLDKDGEPTPDASGVAIYEFQYDNFDNITSSKRFNINSKPILDASNVHQEITDYDDQNRLIFTAYYYPEYVLKFDENFNGASHIVYAADSLKTTYNRDGYNFNYAANDSIAITKEYIDKKGNVVKRMYFNNEEKPALITDGAVTLEMKYDDRGNLVLEKGLDSLGNVFTGSNLVASIAYDYDSSKNKTKITYLDAEDTIVNSNTGEAYTVFVYNAKNLLTEKRNYDKNNNPVAVDDIYKSTYIYNRFNTDSIIQNYSVANTLNPGPSTTRFSYNKFGNQTSETYYNSSGQRATNYAGISRIDYVYNENQKNIGTHYYDKNDRLQNNWYGYAKWNKKLNQNGFVIEESYYNAQNRPTQGDQGYHKIEYEWNTMGVTTLNTTYDKYGNLWENDNGIAIYKFEYFTTGMDSIVEFYDKKNNLTEDLDGIAKITYLKTMNALYYNDKEYDAEGTLLNPPEEIEIQEFKAEELSLNDTIPSTPFSQELEKLEQLLKEDINDESN